MTRPVFWNISATTDEIEVDLLGLIGSYPEEDADSVGAAQFTRELRRVKNAKRLIVNVHSAGGSVWDAISIFESIRAYPGQKVVRVPALAASAATIVMLAGDTIEVGENATLMIHDPHAVAMGGADDLEQTAKRLRKAKEQIVSLYSKRTGNSEEQLEQWMSSETWWSRGQDAIDAGFADKLLSTHSRQYRIAACAPELLKNYKKTPRRLLNKPTPAPVSASIAARLKKLGIG